MLEDKIQNISLRIDEDFDTTWDEILLSMTKIPTDDILESLHKLRIRESDQLKTVLELHDMEMHEEISMPNYQKLKTMVKRSKKIRNSDCETLTPGTGELKQEAVITKHRGAQEPDHNAATPSEASLLRGRSVSKKQKYP